MSVDPGTIAAGVSAAGTLFGGGGKTKAAVPGDLYGSRQNTIQLLNYLLGFNADQSTAPQWNGLGGAKKFGQALKRGAGQGGLPDLNGDPTGRLESFFGKLGVPQSDLQRQSLGGIQQYLNGPAPEQTALDRINQILGQNPGQGVMDALQPRFQQNLAAANAEGPRFGSGNAILKSRAVDDYNLLSAQAYQQGVNQQIQAAQVAQLLGDSIFGHLTQGYGIGKDVAGQQDIETQRRLQLLLQLLGVQQSATLGLPLQQGGDFLSNLGTAANNFAGYWNQRPQAPAGAGGNG